MSSRASFGRVRTVLLLVGIVCAGCVWSTNAVNPLQKVKDVFSRRARKKNKTNNSNHGDLESQAEEILSYNSACDQQLAKAMVILGEQKKAAESALDVCKQHREVARDDIRRLENQVAVADDRVQEKEHEYTEQLQTLRKVTDAQLAEAKFQLTQKDEEMEKRLEDNANQLKTLEAAKNREIEEIRQNHSLEIQRLEQDHENNIVHLKETIESLRQENREDREKAEENLSSIKTESEMHVEKLHNEWSSKLATAESTAKETLEKVKTEADQNIASLSDKLTTCSKELKDNRAAKKKLQAQYDHALQEIATWEQVFGQRKYCNFTYVLEDASMFANQVGDKAIAKLLPLYDQRVKPKVDQAKLKAQPFVDKAWPKIQPVVPKVRAHLEMIGLLLWKKQQMASKEAHAKIKSSFVDATCPQVEGYLKELKKQKGLYSPAVDESVKKACSEADEFLMFMYKSLLVLLAVIFRRLIIRAVFFILFLPLRIMFLPFTLFFSKRERGIRKEHVHQG